MPDTQCPSATDRPCSNAPASQSSTPDRLRLRESRSPSEPIDGVWWPSSEKLADELADLVPALYAHLGAVAAIGYGRDDWADNPRYVDIDGRSIELQGFSSHEPACVLVIGENGHHLTLRVIDPDTDNSQAGQALQEVSRNAAAPLGPGAPRLEASIADVARKLALYEGRNDAVRDAEILLWCDETARQFEDARVRVFVPLLVEHIVTDRIHRERHAGAVPSGSAEA